MGGPPRARKRSSFHAGMILLILAAFSYANDLLGPQEAVFWGGAGLFWLVFSFRDGKSKSRKERENALGRQAFYNQYFGAFAFFAPSIPYLLLLAAFLFMELLPSVRWIVWTLLGVAAAYLLAIWILMAHFLREWRRELEARCPTPKPPWDGADGVL